MIGRVVTLQLMHLRRPGWAMVGFTEGAAHLLCRFWWLP